MEFQTPAKVILSGEHAVVFGKKAISMAINLYIYCKVELLQTTEPIFIHLFFENKDSFFYTLQEILNDQDYDLYDNRNIFKKIIQLITADFILDSSIKLKLSFRSDIPLAMGLGSSASFASSFSAALYSYLAEIQSIKIQDFKLKINNLAFEIEKIFHGNPSGIDNSTVIYGNCLVYQKGKEIQLIEGSLLNSYNIYLIDSKQQKNTKKSVQQVNQYVTDPEHGIIYTNIIDTIGVLTDKLFNLINKNYNEDELEDRQDIFEQLINTNHNLLNSLDLSHPSIDKIIQISKKYRIACKITGAGQGGYCICFIRKNMFQTDFINEIQENNFTILLSNICKNGLQKIDI